MTALSFSERSPCAPDDRAADLYRRLVDTRALSFRLISPLSVDDMTPQAMPDASPAKWHLAHTNWFFETFVVAPNLNGYVLFDERFNFCFNSYYETIGARHPRAKRGLLTRPTVDQILDYRERVDEALAELFAIGVAPDSELARLIEIGINHEQQHQELMLTDILALFAENPLRPQYRDARPRIAAEPPPPIEWIEFGGGVRHVGHTGEDFSWDNEHPRHEVLIHPFQIADRPVTNGEWLEFLEDGGYCAPTLWLSDGWSTVCGEAWRAPRYWENRGGEWREMTLEGLQRLEPAAPVAHVSYYEADAFARWRGKRLPTEFEWEVAAAWASTRGNDLETGALRPIPAVGPKGALRQMFGDVWEWTSSAYAPYPGYRPPSGAIGEYNGKFMIGQQVLRGGSCATPRGHVRASYRNFFYPPQRWQFSGVRLASEIA